MARLLRLALMRTLLVLEGCHFSLKLPPSEVELFVGEVCFPRTRLGECRRGLRRLWDELFSPDTENLFIKEWSGATAPLLTCDDDKSGVSQRAALARRCNSFAARFACLYLYFLLLVTQMLYTKAAPRAPNTLPMLILSIVLPRCGEGVPSISPACAALINRGESTARW